MYVVQAEVKEQWDWLLFQDRGICVIVWWQRRTINRMRSWYFSRY